MLKASLTKIKSALKQLPAPARILLYVAGLLVVVSAILVLLALPFFAQGKLSGGSSLTSPWNPDSPLRIVELRLGNTPYYLEAVDTQAAQQQGLSNRPEPAASNGGMLFLYEDEAQRCMWMKDMRFAIDMLWLDSRKKITKIQKDVRPETYPDAFCARAQYVIELKAGEAERHRLRSGQTLAF